VCGVKFYPKKYCVTVNDYDYMMSCLMKGLILRIKGMSTAPMDSKNSPRARDEYCQWIVIYFLSAACFFYLR
jgi:hypothetical protein